MEKSSTLWPGITCFQAGRCKTAAAQQTSEVVTKNPHHLWGRSTQQHSKCSPCDPTQKHSSSICNRTQGYCCSKTRPWSAPTTQHSCRTATFQSPQCQVKSIPLEVPLKSHHRRCISSTELYCSQKFKCSTTCFALFSFYKWRQTHLLEFIHNSSALCWYLPGTLRNSSRICCIKLLGRMKRCILYFTFASSQIAK